MPKVTLPRKRTPGVTTRPCHRIGCSRLKRYGRSYLYCSDGCARIVHLANKRMNGHKWRPRNERERRLWTRFRLTLDAFDQMLAAQGSACAICKTTEPKGAWHVDHDHKCCTGSKITCGQCVRGILCAYCNQQLLPQLESPFVDAALRYLKLPPFHPDLRPVPNDKPRGWKINSPQLDLL